MHGVSNMCRIRKIAIQRGVVKITDSGRDFRTDVSLNSCSEYHGSVWFGNSSKPSSLLFDPGSSIIAVDSQTYVPGDVAQTVSDKDPLCAVFQAGGDGALTSSDGQCLFQSSYEDGSSIQGYAVEDYLVISKSSGTEKGTPTYLFGVIEDNKASDVNSGSKGGITGFDRGTVSLPSQMYSQGSISQLAFGECGTGPGEQGSFAILGPALPDSSYQSTPLYTGEELNTMKDLGREFDDAVSYISQDDTGYWVLFSGVDIEGQDAPITNASYSPVPMVFDTGNPSLIIPPVYFQGIVSAIRTRVDAMGDEYSFVEQQVPGIGDSILVVPSSGVLDPSVIPDIFPNITVLLGMDSATKITLMPQSYVVSVDLDGTQGFSTKFSSLGSGETVDTADGLNLGAPVIYERFVHVNADDSLMKISELTPGCAFPQSVGQPEQQQEESISDGTPSSATERIYASSAVMFLCLILSLVSG